MTDTAPPQDAAITPISRNYLHDEVARHLRALIQSGELKPQQRLNEVELADRFQISRTPLREAIKILATEGLLDLLPNRGARVASISESEIDEMLEVIAGLEATGGELACARITAAELAHLAALHDRMADAYRRRHHLDYFDLNRQIHEAIIAASRNATLQGIYATLSGRVQRARYAAHKTPEQWQAAMADHERMMDLLRARDGEALARLLRDHVLSKKAVIVATFGHAGDGDADLARA
jgi:DNA-binding GntR family transcriptional regulator